METSMRFKALLALTGTLALAFFLTDNETYGQRGGHGPSAARGARSSDLMAEPALAHAAAVQ